MPNTKRPKPRRVVVVTKVPRIGCAKHSIMNCTRCNPRATSIYERRAAFEFGASIVYHQLHQTLEEVQQLFGEIAKLLTDAKRCDYVAVARQYYPDVGGLMKRPKEAPPPKPRRRLQRPLVERLLEAGRKANNGKRSRG